MSVQRLAGMSALVTGAAQGIGFTIARRLADEGAAVSICDISEAALEHARVADSRLSAYCADVGISAAVQDLVARITTKSGGLEIVVNNAGIAGPCALVEEVTDEQWDNTLRINLTSTFFVARAVIPQMKRTGRGSIINISTSSARTGLPNRTPYVVSKTGMLAITRNLAREVGPYGIRCNAILPGAVRSARGAAMISARAAALKVSEQEIVQRTLNFVSMRTFIEPSEIAAMAAFLASDEAGHVTGQFIGVCGNVEWEA